MNANSKPSGWATGGTALAAAMLLMIGAWQALAGIAAISEDEIFLRVDDYLYSFDLTTWGWIHLLIGVLVLVTGCFVLIGRSWARWIAIGMAIISATAQFFWLPYQPFWSLAIIALDVFVVWALISIEAGVYDTSETRAAEWDDEPSTPPRVYTNRARKAAPSDVRTTESEQRAEPEARA